MTWLIKALSVICIKLLDHAAYGILSVSYNVFYAVSQLDIFGGSEAGALLYDKITGRLYTVLSILMVFVFAYKLIMLIVDPDGKEKGAASQMVKRTIIAIIAIILAPTIYKYMQIFQNHVVDNGTISQIIMGTWGGNSNKNTGDKIALIMYSSFYHPRGMSIIDFYDENGNVLLPSSITPSSETDAETVQMYAEDLYNWETTDESLNALLYDDELRGKLIEDEGETMEYTWILATVCALGAAWMFLVYSIDIGTRAVKLGMLELISPIPIVLSIFPQTKKTFDTWLSHMEKTYLEIFIRLAIIFFGVELCKLVPTFIFQIFPDANNNLTSSDVLTQCIATVLLILGILKFCSTAPDLFKEIFSAGGRLLEGVNLKPRMRSHIEDNKLAMKGYGALAAGIGGATTRFGNAWRSRYDSLQQGDPGVGNTLKHGVLAGISSMGEGFRGLATGAKLGYKNAPTEINKKSNKEILQSGADEARTKLEKNKPRIDRMNAENEYIKQAKAHDNILDAIKDKHEFMKSKNATFTDSAIKAYNDYEKEKKDDFNALMGFDPKKKSDQLSQLKSAYSNLNNTTKSAVDPKLTRALELAQQQYNRLDVNDKDYVDNEAKALQNIQQAEENIRKAQADFLSNTASEDYRNKMLKSIEDQTRVLQTTDKKTLADVENMMKSKYKSVTGEDFTGSMSDIFANIKAQKATGNDIAALQTYTQALGIAMAQQADISSLKVNPTSNTNNTNSK